MGKRIPQFWLNQSIDFRTSCRVVEEVYKDVMESVHGSRMRWVKLVDCKDIKKRNMYLGSIVNFLKLFTKFFEGVMFDEVLLKQAVRDVFEVGVRWYGDYFVFSNICSLKMFEVFERWIKKNYGSINRYVELVSKKGSRKKVDVRIDVLGDDLRKVGSLYTF